MLLLAGLVMVLNQGDKSMVPEPPGRIVPDVGAELSGSGAGVNASGLRFAERFSADELERILKDPAPAAEEARNGDESRYRDLLVVWAIRDPDAVLAWVGRHPEIDALGPMASVLAGMLAAGRGADEVAAFLDTQESNPRLAPKWQGESLLPEAIRLMAREDSAGAAVDLILEKRDPVLAGSFAAAIDDEKRRLAAMNYLSGKGVKMEFHYTNLAEMMGKDGPGLADWASRNQPELLNEMVSSWCFHVDKSGGSAKRWLESSVLPPERRAVLAAEIDRCLEVPEGEERHRGEVGGSMAPSH